MEKSVPKNLGYLRDLSSTSYFIALIWNILKQTKTLWPLFMDGVQLRQDQSHSEETVYFLPLSSQKFLVLILSTSEGRKAESTLEPPSGFEHETPGMGIQRLNH